MGMSRLRSPSDKLFDPDWKSPVSLIEINMDSPFVEEQLQELTNLYDIPVDLSEKIVILETDSSVLFSFFV